MDEVTRARNKAIATAIIEGLTEQHISVSEAQDILYQAENLVREKSDSQALSDMLHAITKRG